MEHTESSSKIYHTNEYGRFRMLNGNRLLNEGKIKRIIKEVSCGNDMLAYYPIQVQENKDRLDILDGQHRFYICKKLKRSVFYILVKEKKSMPEIAMVNSNVEKWKPADYLNCYIQTDNRHYEILREFIEQTGIGLHVAMKLLQTGRPGSEGSVPEMNENFKNGNFEATHLTEAQLMYSTVSLFKDFPHHTSRAFIIAIDRITTAGLVDIQDVVNAVKKRPEMLVHHDGYKGYVNLLEQILNVGKQKRIVIV